jgi:hypothetical protein
MSKKIKAIKVLGMKYKVFKLPKKHKRLNDRNESHYAVIANSKNEIYIRDDISKERFDGSILHEVIHSVDVELGLGLEEETIMRLTSGLRSAGVHIDLKH